MVIHERFYTAADLWELSHAPEYDEMRLELSRGRLIVMSPVGGKHGGLAIKMGAFVVNYVDEHDLGYVTAAETGYILYVDAEGKDTVRAPDVGFVSLERLPDGLPDGYIPFAPDLAVEVVSPNDSATAVQDKVTEYLQHGTRMVWVLYPKSENINVHTPSGAKTLGVDDRLDGGDVLPGFTLPVRVLFGKKQTPCG